MKKNVGYKAAFEWLESFSFGILFIMLLFVFVVKIYTVVGDSMYPTLVNGEKVVVLQLGYTPSDGDMVVVDSHSKYGKTLVKRVIATENQTVDISKTGDLTVDGKLIDSSELNVRGTLDYPITVPEGSLFLMGDNRGVSLDSRSSDVGFINEDNIMGKIIYVFGSGQSKVDR